LPRSVLLRVPGLLKCSCLSRPGSGVNDLF
jgi:hypothetical protein